MNKLLVLLGSVLLFLNVQGQVMDPVKWTYKVESLKNGNYSLVFTAKMENKWHLYSQDIPDGGPIPTSFTFVSSPDYGLIGKVAEKTKAEEKFDESFQIKVKTFSHEARFVQTIKAKSAKAFVIKGTIEYMSCNDSQCLPPKEKDFEFKVPAADETAGSADKLKLEETPVVKDTSVSAAAANTQTQNAKTDTTAATEQITKSSGPENTNKADGSLWAFFLIAFGAGIAGIFTPCVYPMIPMTVSFFMQGENKRSAGMLKGLVFGLSIILIYTLIGVVVMLTQSGADITSVISSHWVPNIIFFLLFLVFAASFFGMFEIVLPGTLANKVDQQAEKGGIIGAFFMALTLVIVSFSCTGPIVGAILVEASKGIAFKPVLGMFGFSLAFAIPFVIFAFSPTLMKKMAKSGTWLNAVKVVFAFILLAFSLKFISTVDTVYHWGILSREIYLSVWIVIFVLLGFYLLGKLKFAHDSEMTYIGVPRFILAIAAFSFSVYLVPGLFGAPLSGISSLLPPQTSTSIFSAAPNTSNNSEKELCKTPKYSEFLHLPLGLNGYFDYNEGLACAKEKNKPIFLDIKGHACANCKKMESTVWSDPEVLEKLRNDFIIIALYTDDRYKLAESDWVTSAIDGEVKKTIGAKNLDFEIARFNTNTQPLYAILDLKGDTLTSPVGLTDIATFSRFLEEGKRNFNKRQ